MHQVMPPRKTPQFNNNLKLFNIRVILNFLNILYKKNLLYKSVNRFEFYNFRDRNHKLNFEFINIDLK